MNNRTEKLVQDLFEIDPSFKNDEAFVRALAELMVETKPFVVPDAALKTILRAKLLAHYAINKKATTFEWPWWVSYAVPAAFVFLLMVTTTPPIGVIHREHNLGDVPTIVKSAPASMIADEAATNRGVTSSFAESDSLSRKAGEVLNETEVSAQLAGFEVVASVITLNKPAFAVVSESLSGDILGVSRLLPVGRSESLVVVLKKPTEVGGSYEFTLYSDDGDGIFDKDLDGKSRYGQFFEVY